MDIRKRIVLICIICIMICGCGKEKGKIVIEVPSGHSTANSYINSAEKEYDDDNYYNALNDYLKV